MAGGRFEDQNKIRPGTYTNYETDSLATPGLDSAGAVVIPLALDWGEVGKFIKVSPKTNFLEAFGKGIADLLPIREAFKANGNVLVYNLSGSNGVNASATSGTFVATAKHAGTDGNKVSVTVTVGLNGTSTVRTYFSGVIADTQTVATAADLVANAYVTFSGALPSADATLTLIGGTTEASTNESYSDLAVALSTENFKTIALSTKDEAIKLILSLQVKMWRDEEGKNVTLVTSNYNAADHEGVVSIKNGITLDNGTELTAEQVVYWYAAAYAAAGSKSLTYAEYPGAIDCERLTDAEIKQALKDGHIVFTYNEGADGIDKVVVEQDINTFRSFTVKKNQDFRKNKIIRERDIMDNNIQHIHNRSFIGKVNGSHNGRNLFKGAIMTNVLDPMVRRDEIDPYNPDEIVVTQGVEKDATVVVVGVKFIDAMEKAYVSVNCK